MDKGRPNIVKPQKRSSVWLKDKPSDSSFFYFFFPALSFSCNPKFFRSPELRVLQHAWGHPQSKCRRTEKEARKLKFVEPGGRKKSASNMYTKLRKKNPIFHHSRPALCRVWVVCGRLVGCLLSLTLWRAHKVFFASVDLPPMPPMPSMPPIPPMPPKPPLPHYPPATQFFFKPCSFLQLTDVFARCCHAVWGIPPFFWSLYVSAICFSFYLLRRSNASLVVMGALQRRRRLWRHIHRPLTASCQPVILPSWLTSFASPRDTRHFTVVDIDFDFIYVCTSSTFNFPTASLTLA